MKSCLPRAADCRPDPTPIAMYLRKIRIAGEAVTRSVSRRSLGSVPASCRLSNHSLPTGRFALSLSDPSCRGSGGILSRSILSFQRC